MSIIGSDFHGNLSKVKRFLEYLPEEEHIFAGDVLDSFDRGALEQIQSLNALLDSDCKLIWGNHELHYLKNRPFHCSGYQRESAPMFQQMLESNKKRFKNALIADDYLITHAGLATLYSKEATLEKQANLLNKKPACLYKIGFCRGGRDVVGGPFWFDYLREYNPIDTSDKHLLSKKYNQVFGHTASKEPWEDKGEGYHHVCINTDDRSDKAWVFNTKTKQIEELV